MFDCKGFDIIFLQETIRNLNVGVSSGVGLLFGTMEQVNHEVLLFYFKKVFISKLKMLTKIMMVYLFH